ncbi:MAG: hypothetical protein ACXVXI_01745 [Mycobacteriaceae bacterium]
MNWLAGLFLIAHGLVHVAVWCTPFEREKAPFDPKRSWLAVRFGCAPKVRPIAVGLAVAAAFAFMVAGAGVSARAGWAPGLALVGALVSLVLALGFFHRWLSFSILVNLAIIVVVL